MVNLSNKPIKVTANFEPVCQDLDKLIDALTMLRATLGKPADIRIRVSVTGKIKSIEAKS